MRLDQRDWLVVCVGRKALILENLGGALQGELGNDLFKLLPVHEIEKQLLLSGGQLSLPPGEDASAPLRSRGAGGRPGRDKRPRSGSSGWSTGRRNRRRRRA
jgi:hypothetical protein